jgi:hypothetical protein
MRKHIVDNLVDNLEMANNLAIGSPDTRGFSTYVDQRDREGGDDEYSHCSIVMLFFFSLR